MRIIDETQLDFDDVLIQPKRSELNSRSEVSLHRNIGWGSYTTDNNGNKKWSHNINCIPITCANMATVGNVKMVTNLVLNDYIGTLDKHISEYDIRKLYDFLFDNSLDSDHFDEITSRVSISIGIKENCNIIKSLVTYCNSYPKIITIDVPNGYCPKLIDRIKEVKDIAPDSFVIAGNVVTSDRVYDILNAGADASKIGIGPGSVCETRKVTGVGRPQLSTIIECADAAHQLNKYIVADGGCKEIGDICKAFCGGADIVMTGSMFSGCEESEGDIIIKDNKKYKEYYGMSSKLAQERHFGGFQSTVRASEGREKLVPYKGPVLDVIRSINGGLRSCCTYIGCNQIKNMNKNCTFYKVNRQLNNLFVNCPDI